MGKYYGMIIFLGILIIVIGICIYKFPDIMWELSLSRRWFVKGGEPTEYYYTSQRWRAITYIVLGAVMILLSISMSVTEARGYVVEIEGNKLRIPCAYSDVEALGYQVSQMEEIKTLRATNKNLKESATYTVKNAEGKELTITFENRGDEECLATECELIAIKTEAENGPKMQLPNGVKVGMSESDVNAIMGRGTPRGVGTSAAEYTPKVNFDAYKVYVVYGGDFRNKKVTSIRVEDVIY